MHLRAGPPEEHAELLAPALAGRRLDEPGGDDPTVCPLGGFYTHTHICIYIYIYIYECKHIYIYICASLKVDASVDGAESPGRAPQPGSSRGILLLMIIRKIIIIIIAMILMLLMLLLLLLLIIMIIGSARGGGDARGAATPESPTFRPRTKIIQEVTIMCKTRLHK